MANVEDGFLTQDAPNTPDEYTMNPAADLVWITVRGLSVHIIQEDDEVRVDIFALDQEFENDGEDEPIASCKVDASQYPAPEEEQDA